MGKDYKLIRSFIKKYEENFAKLKKMIKNGEISNPINLNGPIYLDGAESYGRVVCTFLEKFIQESEKDQESF